MFYVVRYSDKNRFSQFVGKLSIPNKRVSYRTESLKLCSLNCMYFEHSNFLVKIELSLVSVSQRLFI